MYDNKLLWFFNLIKKKIIKCLYKLNKTLKVLKQAFVAKQNFIKSHN
jgi:hypothetical protein